MSIHGKHEYKKTPSDGDFQALYSCCLPNGIHWKLLSHQCENINLKEACSILSHKKYTRFLRYLMHFKLQFILISSQTGLLKHELYFHFIQQ